MGASPNPGPGPINDWQSASLDKEDGWRSACAGPHPNLPPDGEGARHYRLRRSRVAAVGTPSLSQPRAA